MTRCAKCGSVALAPQWTMFVPWCPPSQNEAFGRSHWAIKRDRQRWAEEIAAEMRGAGVPQATGKRRLVLTRVYSGREQIRDYGNLVGGMKMVIDAMHVTYTRPITTGKRKGQPVTVYGAGLILDDTPDMLDDVYLQERSSCRQSGLRIEITDFGPLPGQLSLLSADQATLQGSKEIATP